MFSKFVEDKISFSKKSVLRGLHGDEETYKLISCIYGDIFLAIADMRVDNRTLKHTKTFYLSDKKPTMILVPPGCVNGHLCLSKECIFFYKWSKKYTGPEEQITVRWNDPSLNIPWPIEDPILSERDRNAALIN